MPKFTFTILIFMFLLAVSGCKTKEKLLYFQQGSLSEASKNAHFTPVFKVDDFLAIVVTGDDPEAALPFNMPPEIRQVQAGYNTGNPALNGYLIDAEGMVNLPVLGAIKLGGLNRMEATKMLTERLQSYVKNPVVNIQIQNFKITVLGDVKTPGTYRIPNERITVLEAIGLAGDLRMTGNRKVVSVIRDEDGNKTEYLLDLTTKDVFSSPAYYLTQNDVVYVQPNGTARSESTLWRTAGPIFISLTSLVVTTATLLFR